MQTAIDATAPPHEAAGLAASEGCVFRLPLAPARVDLLDKRVGRGRTDLGPQGTELRLSGDRHAVDSGQAWEQQSRRLFGRREAPRRVRRAPLALVAVVQREEACGFAVKAACKAARLPFPHCDLVGRAVDPDDYTVFFVDEVNDGVLVYSHF